jgi:hypothetical protein
MQVHWGEGCATTTVSSLAVLGEYALLRRDEVVLQKQAEEALEFGYLF